MQKGGGSNVLIQCVCVFVFNMCYQFFECLVVQRENFYWVLCCYSCRVRDVLQQGDLFEEVSGVQGCYFFFLFVFIGCVHLVLFLVEVEEVVICFVLYYDGLFVLELFGLYGGRQFVQFCVVENCEQWDLLCFLYEFGGCVLVQVLLWDGGVVYVRGQQLEECQEYVYGESFEKDDYGC